MTPYEVIRDALAHHRTADVAKAYAALEEIERVDEMRLYLRLPSGLEKLKQECDALCAEVVRWKAECERLKATNGELERERGEMNQALRAELEEIERLRRWRDAFEEQRNMDRAALVERVIEWCSGVAEDTGAEFAASLIRDLDRAKLLELP